MSIWIQLTQPKSVETNGIRINYKAGDWVEVGKQTAASWIQQGIAKRSDFSLASEYIDMTSGIVVVNSKNHQLINNIKQDLPGIDISESNKPEMLFSENMIWSNAVKIKRENVIIGFKLLDKWQVATPLYSYDKLAVHLVSDKDKDYCLSVLHDLRVPVYNTNLLFIRRCEQTQELINQWNQEQELIDNPHLAFHIAYYKTKVLLNALPVSWILENKE